MEFTEYLQDCSYNQKYNIFNKLSDEANIKEMFESFLSQAFSSDELKELEIIKNINLDINHRTPLHGKIDYCIWNQQQNTELYVMIPKF